MLDLCEFELITDLPEVKLASRVTDAHLLFLYIHWNVRYEMVHVRILMISFKSYLQLPWTVLILMS